LRLCATCNNFIAKALLPTGQIHGTIVATGCQAAKELWKPERGLPETHGAQPSFFCQAEKGADAVNSGQPTA